MTNKCTIILQIITLLHVSTLTCHPQGACNQYLDKLHKFFQMQLLVIQFKIKMFHTGFTQVFVFWSLKSQYYKIFKILKYKDSVILRFQRIKYENLHKTYVKHLNFKLCYQQLYLKSLCNLARYWLQAPWGWHDSVETCRSVIICEIIVHLLVIVQNKECIITNL